jgi:hypothetical protein
MQKLTIQHGERRCAVNIDMKLHNPPDPQQSIEGFIRERPLQLAVLWPGQSVDLVEFVGKVELELKACESHADAPVEADTPCIVVNNGPDSIEIACRGRYAGMTYPMECGEQRAFPLSVFDDAEVLEISIKAAPAGIVAPSSSQPRCANVPCDMVDGICPRCAIGQDQAARQLLEGATP